jgi:hypothetical protein
MNTTTYKKRIPSPFQVSKKPYTPANVSDSDTVRDEVKKLLGTHQFTATFEEDVQTTTALKHIPGIVAFLCTIKKGDKVIGQGRGTTAINQVNRFIVRTINYAWNASLVDAIVRSTKILDVFRPDNAPHPWVNSQPQKQDDYAGDAPITAKQKELLTSLIYQHIGNEDEQERRLQEAESLSKDDAGEMISNLLAASRR